MCQDDDNVSPYLRRRLRSYRQAMRDREGISRGLLIRAIAYEMQAKRYGRLKPALDRRLRMIANGSVDGDSKATPTLQPGARLVREWNGVSHVVEVIEGGFIWNGDRHRSLSAIARAITGARWSGPRFFGLTSGESQ